jgi:hypothetical protein
VTFFPALIMPALSSAGLAGLEGRAGFLGLEPKTFGAAGFLVDAAAGLAGASLTAAGAGAGL